MTDTDMLYMAALEKRNSELEARIAELEDKHWNECRQIAHYDDELKTSDSLLGKAMSQCVDLDTEAWKHNDIIEKRKMLFSQRLKKALEELNVTQTELCKRTDIPKSAMSQYVSGNFQPKQDRLYKIADSLNISPAWLMGYTAGKIELKALLGEIRPVLKRAYFADPDDTKLANVLYDKINDLIGRE